MLQNTCILAIMLKFSSIIHLTLIYLAETFVKACLFNKAVLYMILQFVGDFFPSHHVGFPLSPFTDLLCIRGYHSTLNTQSGGLMQSLGENYTKRTKTPNFAWLKLRAC